MFPPDDILLARGKYSTLNRERRAQVDRLQKTADHAMRQLQALLKLMSTFEPHTAPMTELKRCVESLEDASNKLVQICAELNDLHPTAWGDGNETEEVR